MKIVVQKDEFQKQIASVINAVNPRATLPILSNIHILADKTKGLILTGTDLELSLISFGEAKIEEEGNITVPGKKLQDIIRELPQGEFELSSSKNNTVTIKAGNANFKVMGLGSEDFPKMAEINKNEAIEIEQKDLKECIQLTIFAVSKDETRYVLNGVLFSVVQGEIKMVATDGRRMAFIKKIIEGGSEKKMESIIPTKAIHELSRALGEQGKVHVIIKENQIIFSFEDQAIVSRLIEGHFPNYEQVIPKTETTQIKTDRDKLLAAVKRAALLTSTESQAIKVDIGKKSIMVSSKAPNMGEAREEVEAETEGDELVIGFNPNYLIDVLKNLNMESVSIGLSHPEKPAVIKGKDGYICVIMPMQLS